MPGRECCSLHLPVGEEVEDDVPMGCGVGVAAQQGIEEGVAGQLGSQYRGDPFRVPAAAK